MPFFPHFYQLINSVDVSDPNYSVMEFSKSCYRKSKADENQCLTFL